MWKDIEGFEGRYQINECGYVQNKKTSRLLKRSLDADGYEQIGIRKLGYREKIWFRIHRLVAISFMDKPDNWKELCVDHIDRNITNNNVLNLRWVTILENNNNRKQTCWKTNNSTGELYVSKYKNGYMIRINNAKLKHTSFHKSLNEAIATKNSLLFDPPP